MSRRANPTVRQAFAAAVLSGALIVSLLAPAAAQETPPEPPLKPFQPFRVAQFSRYIVDGTEVLDEPIIRDGGRLNFHQRFPDSHFDREPNDELNIGRIFSNPSGVTYGVEVQSPGNDLTTVADPAREIGNKADLAQFQNFRKDSESATLRYTVTSAEIMAVDENEAGFEEPARPLECPAEDSTCQFTMEGEVALTVGAYLTDAPPEQREFFYFASGGIKMSGFQGSFLPEVYVDPFSTGQFWTETDFDFDPNAEPLGDYPGSFAFLTLIAPRTFEVDISSVPVGEEFTLDINTFAKTIDHRVANFDTRRGSTVFAYLRDPLEVGGAQLQTTGLTRVPDPLTEPPPPPQVAPVECDGGPDPASGTLQFSTTASAIGEWAGAAPQVFVTRTGGSAGEVSATVSTSDGTAVAGEDYTPLTSTIRFGDGDTTSRAVPLEIVQDAIAEDDSTVNLALSDPSCATLGAPSTSVLTIVDDDRPVVPPPTFSIGGTVTGLEGSGLVVSHLGEALTPGNGPFEFAQTVPDTFPYIVTVTTQPAGPAQVCTMTNGVGTVAGADVTDIAVDCVTTPPDEELDSSFGEGGKVMTPDIRGAKAVVVQPDGKLVAAGEFSLARYDTDGTLDENFGDEGTVRTDLGAGFTDFASDVALQPDGSIVVVGILDDGGANDENFGVQRYDGNGILDTDFGDEGTVTTDFNGGTDRAYGVAVQGDGKIVVAGQASDVAGTGNDFAVARYDTAGTLDTSFGTNGTGLVTTNVVGVVDFGHDVALDADGNIVVVGRASNNGATGERFGVVRYTPAGGLDSNFGIGGIATAVFSAGSIANGVTLDPDGRILVTGNAGTDFALARFLDNGSLDVSFDGDGLVTTDFGNLITGRPAPDFGKDVAVQADGKIVVVGVSELAVGADLALARYLDSGSLDPSFGSDGLLNIDFAGGFDSGHDVAIQTDGKIVAVGEAVNGTTVQFALVRVNP